MLRSIFVGLITGLVCTATWSQSFVESDHVDLKDIDPFTENGSLGTTLALAGTGRTLLATAPGKTDDTDPGSQDGSVYSFTIQANGTLGTPQTLEPFERFQFGKILAADGDWAAIGESGNKVHLYRRVAGSWSSSQLLEIDPDVPQITNITVRRLDSHAAMDGNLLAIGNTTANLVVGGNTLSNGGAVVLFRRAANDVWSHEATLIAPNPVSSSAFGEVVAVSGDTLLVGAPDDSPPGGGKGGAYLFQRQAGSWNHVRTLRNPDSAQSAAFGWSVAIDQDLAIVGCATCFTSLSGPSNTGSFFSYERNLGGSGNWGLRGEFVGNQPEFIDEFSRSLYLKGQTLLVGSPNANYAAFFLRNIAGVWTPLQTLPAGDPNNTSFGRSVVFSGGYAVVGASRWPNTSTSERWGAISAWFSEPVERCGGNLDGIFCDRFENSPAAP